MAPGEENPFDDPDPGPHSVGIRLTRQDSPVDPVQALRRQRYLADWPYFLAGQGRA